MLITLIRKEIKEMLTKSTIFYMVFIALIFALTGQMISSTQEGAAEKPLMALVNRDSGVYGAMVTGVLEAGAELVYTGTDSAAARQALENRSGMAILTVPESFSRDIQAGKRAQVDILWLMRGAGMMDSIPQAVVQGLLVQAGREISTSLIEENSQLNAQVVLDPTSSYDITEYKGKTIDGLGPGEISGILGARTLVVPIAVMMLILMASGSVISSMGMEKENRTLETLLTMPSHRSHIIISKIVGSGVAGLVMGVIYMIGFYSYFNSLGASAANLPELGLAMNVGDYGLMGLSVFAALMAALSLTSSWGVSPQTIVRADADLSYYRLAMLP